MYLNQKKLKIKINKIFLSRKKLIKKYNHQKKSIDIVYEDKDLIIINKPQGMVVHPGAGNKNDTLVNILVGKL